MNEMSAKQKALDAEIKALELTHSYNEGMVEVTLRGDLTIQNLSIDREKVNWSDKEQVEDYVILAINEALAAMEQKKVALTQSMMTDMLPPGLGGFKDLFS